MGCDEKVSDEDARGDEITTIMTLEKTNLQCQLFVFWTSVILEDVISRNSNMENLHWEKFRKIPDFSESLKLSPEIRNPSVEFWRFRIRNLQYSVQ